jgi:hypothetical protein
MTCQNLWLWISDHPPTETGWYATTHCWDPYEGIFPGAHFWNAEWISEGHPIGQRSPMAFTSKAEALEWAYQHDPEGSSSLIRGH